MTYLATNNLSCVLPRQNLLVFGKAVVALLFVIAITSFAGCASVPSTIKEDPKFWQKRAVERANQRWAHIRAKEYEKAFAMYTQVSQKDFSPEILGRQIAQTRMSNGVAESAECKEEACEVTVNIDITIHIPRVGNKQQTVPFKEQWVVESGEIRLLRN